MKHNYNYKIHHYFIKSRKNHEKITKKSLKNHEKIIKKYIEYIF